MPQELDLPYVMDEALTGLAIAYLPTGFIADKILTKSYVDSPEFKYRYYEKGQFLTNTDTEIGEYGEPVEDEFRYKELHEGTAIYSHSTKLSVRHLNAPTSEKNKEAKRVMMSKAKLMLSDEVRLANLLRNKDNYKGNATILTSSNNFSNASVKVIKTIQECMDKMYKRPNLVVMSTRMASALRTCPQIIASSKGKEVVDGLVSMDFLRKEVFDVENILVGDTRVNSNKRGQDISLSYVWGNDLIFLYIDESADLDCGVTFGQRAIYKDYNTQTYLKAGVGAEGVKYYKTGDEHKDIITCPDCGYIIKNAFTFS